ncbi:MAG: hypothetical protein JOZ43_03360 [Acidobacteriales bacterium]|nr:hypothetical protein [Terriglobales bacterium]
MPKIRLCFLWHMHQPYYKDLRTGKYRLPWVRLHALKDYYGMVKLLDEFPGVHQTFNLVPSLLKQISDYVDGTASDALYDIVAKPAGDLEHEERLLALQYLFQANETHMIARYPRFLELLQAKRGAHDDLARVAVRWSDQDFRDLQVLSQLAWFDEFWIDGDPEVAALVAKGKAFDHGDQQLMLRKQHEILSSVIPAYRRAMDAHQIEISVTPYYHPILPLVCDTNIGRVSAPGIRLPASRFQRPEDAKLQMVRALEYADEVFGSRPAGMWPSEGSVSNEVLEIGASLKLQWVATDEGVLGRSINTFFSRNSEGILDPTSANGLYRVYRYEVADTELGIVFRDHSLSDLIGFVYAGMPAKEAAQHFVQQLKQSAEPVLASGRDAVVSVILDGENAWEHFPRNGREFLRRLYGLLQADPLIEAETIGSAVQATPFSEAGKIRSITPGSWINSNFNIWIGAPEDNTSWDLLSAARTFYDQHANDSPSAARALALEELLIAEGSDWNWWYGPEHHTANDPDFDELYRDHLSNVYLALGATPPDELSLPITTAVVHKGFTPQSQYIHPSMTRETVSYFDWLGAAVLSAEAEGAMHMASRRLSAAYAGFDETFFFARLDFRQGPPKKAECVLDIEAVAPSGDSTRTQLHVSIDESKVQRWWLRRDPSDTSRALIRIEDLDEGTARMTQVLEIRVQRSALRAESGGVLKMRFSLREREMVESLPREGWMTLDVLSEDALITKANRYW